MRDFVWDLAVTFRHCNGTWIVIEYLGGTSSEMQLIENTVDTTMKAELFYNLLYSITYQMRNLAISSVIAAKRAVFMLSKKVPFLRLNILLKSLILALQ